MKKVIVLFITLLIAFALPVSVCASDGNVTYNSNANEFIFEPGSEYSPTDLFPNFKDVMPGDSLTQKITFRNDKSKNVKIKVYMRALGAHEDSAEFLNQMNLRVEKSVDNEMAYMFDAAADETAQLTNWKYLGTLYSGGEVNLNAILDVPTSMDNYWQEQVGYLDWEFMIEELPVEDSDPEPPKTGDSSDLTLWIIIMICSAVLVFVIILLHRKDSKKKEN